MIKIRAPVISTGGPQSGPKWRNLLKKLISLRGSSLRFVSRFRFDALHLGCAIGRNDAKGTFIKSNWYKSKYKAGWLQLLYNLQKEPHIQVAIPNG